MPGSPEWTALSWKPDAAWASPTASFCYKSNYRSHFSVIIAGVRVATVRPVGVATIAAAIGAGGLGEYIFRGLAMVNNNLILAGAIPPHSWRLPPTFYWDSPNTSCCRGSPRDDDLSPSPVPRLRPSERRHPGLLRALACGPARAGPHRCGSKAFSRAGHRWARSSCSTCSTVPASRLNAVSILAGTYICQQAILSGRIDIYPEYTGTALTAVLKQPASSDAAAVYQQVRESYARRFNLDVEPSLGFNNTFAMIIRGEDAHRLGLTTLSQAAAYAARVASGFRL